MSGAQGPVREPAYDPARDALDGDALAVVEILLVEDSVTDAEMTIRALKRHNLANHLVWVKDGAEALEFINCTGAWSNRPNGNPKLVLLDLKMPRVDGIEVLERLRQDDSMRSVPIVMLTSSAEETDIVKSYALGANSYLVKPVEFTRFMDEVANAGLYWAVLNRVPGPSGPGAPSRHG
jgi:CheY-like chemotaxis protein